MLRVGSVTAGEKQGSRGLEGRGQRGLWAEGQLGREGVRRQEAGGSPGVSHRVGMDFPSRSLLISPSDFVVFRGKGDTVLSLQGLETWRRGGGVVF